MSEAPVKPGAGYFSLVNQLRGIAALLVLWDHLVGQWLAQRALQWAPADLMTRFVTGPLNVIQHMGFLGVALFFLISGFVVTRAVTLEPTRVFLIRRAVRIYPPLIGAVGLAVAVAFVTKQLGLGSDAWDQITPAAILQSMTLANWVSVPQVVIVGVAWSLVIELIFYACLAAVAPIFRSRLPDLCATGAILALVLVVGLLERAHGPGFFLFSISVSYVPLLVLGQIVYLVTQRGAKPLAGAGVGVVCWGIFVWGLERTQPAFLTADGSYGSSLSIALGAFVAAVLWEGKLRPARWLTSIAARSYTLYLVHGLVGLLVLEYLWRHGLAYRWALLAALAAVAVVTEVMHRLVERPSIALGRRWTRRYQRKGPRGSEPVVVTPPPAAAGGERLAGAPGTSVEQAVPELSGS